MKLGKRKLWGAVAGLVMATPSFASVIAVVDTGVDLTHRIFSDRAFINTLEVDGNGADEDQNGVPDDVHGWSFVDACPKSFDPNLLTDLPDEVYKMQSILEKVEAATASSDEIIWFRQAINNNVLMQAFDFYLGLSHGTHVAGISVKGNADTKVMSVKYLGPANKPEEEEAVVVEEKLTEEKLIKEKPASPIMKGKPMEEVWKVVASSLSEFADEQGKDFETMARYVQRNSDVVNGSFGSSPLMPQVMRMLAGFFYQLTGRVPTTDEYMRMANYLYGLESAHIKTAIDQSATTLFVFAAGNDNSDNDVIPVNPANHGSENGLTVAATVGRSSLADFSNFGATKVDVAAPGSNILSSSPGKLSFLRMSGTSQAAPYVSNTALKMIDANPQYFSKNLTKRATVLKKLIMGTVDKKDWLVGKVVSAGIVNQERAVAAAKMLGKMSVENAIGVANAQIADLEDARDLHASEQWANLGMKPIVAPMSSGIRADAEIRIVKPVLGKSYPQI